MQVVSPLPVLEVESTRVVFVLGSRSIECGHFIEIDDWRGTVTDVVSDTISALVPVLAKLLDYRDGPTIRRMIEAAYHRPVSLTDMLTVYVLAPIEDNKENQA